MVTEEHYAGRLYGDTIVDRDSARLVVSARDRGELWLHGCAFVVFAMGCILTLGIMAMVAQTHYGADAASFFAPRRNHLGFLWLTSTIAMVVFLPLWIRYVDRRKMVVVLSRPDAMVRRNGQDVTPFSRMECVRLHETRDAEGVYVYEVALAHTDGMELLVSAGYDERVAMNLANEIGTFTGLEVRWR